MPYRRSEDARAQARRAHERTRPAPRPEKRTLARLLPVLRCRMLSDLAACGGRCTPSRFEAEALAFEALAAVHSSALTALRADVAERLAASVVRLGVSGTARQLAVSLRTLAAYRRALPEAPAGLLSLSARLGGWSGIGGRLTVEAAERTSRPAGEQAERVSSEAGAACCS